MVGIKRNALATSRKVPIQDRSKRTVQAILQAASQVLVRSGYENTTTGSIAERAGVSIGTLYQYFPNKELLVASVIEDHFKEVLSTVESAMRTHINSSRDAWLRAIIYSSLEAHRLQPDLHKVLIEQVPRVGKYAQALELSEKLCSLLQEHLAHHLPGTPAYQLPMLAFVLETTIEALTHRAVIESPQWLISGELEAQVFMLLAPYIEQAAQSSNPELDTMTSAAVNRF
uniref:TetR/AcrR family transcriptional regulator n=1 Tax=Pseudomonas veronii TaxID=76761 RepID=UPI003C7CDC28